MVNDVLAETGARAAEAIGRSTTVRGAGRPLAGFSPAMAAEERVLKAFLHARMYDAPEVQAVRDEAQAMLADLFAAYRDDPGAAARRNGGPRLAAKPVAAARRSAISSPA